MNTGPTGGRTARVGVVAMGALLLALLLELPVATAGDTEAFVIVDADVLAPCAYVVFDGETWSTTGTRAAMDGSCPDTADDATVGTGPIPLPPLVDVAVPADLTSYGELTAGVAVGGVTVVCVTVDPDAMPPDVSQCVGQVCRRFDVAICMDHVPLSPA